MSVVNYLQYFYSWNPFSFTQTISIFILIIFFKDWIFKTFINKSKKIPPGPFGLPILGNVLQIGNEPWKTCLDWKKIYGPIVSLRVAHIQTIVLTDSKSIREAFALSALSGRPKLKLFERPQGQGLGPTDGPLQMEQRQFAMKQMKNLVLQNQKMEESIRDELQLVIKNIEQESKDGRPIHINHRFSIPTLSSIWSSFMGHRVEHDDFRMTRILKFLQESTTFDGVLAKLAFFIPTLSTLFPEATGYNKFVKEVNETCAVLEKELHELPPTYIPGQPTNYREAYADMIRLNEDNPNSSFYPPMNFFPYTLLDILAGAVETTGTSIEWALIAFVRNPKVQNQIYKEIHSVCGEDFPTLLDRGKCPYTEAVVYEILRRHTVLPFAIIHRAMEDVPDFSGYKIKKNTLVIPNLYGVHMDSEIWGDPENFRPERFLDDPENKKSLLAFSAGRRSCIGEGAAKDQMFLYIATLVQKFHIKPVPGNLPTLEGAVGVVCAPKPFKLIFVKR